MYDCLDLMTGYIQSPVNFPPQKHKFVAVFLLPPMTIGLSTKFIHKYLNFPDKQDESLCV
jgi:hypothetical protein